MGRTAKLGRIRLTRRDSSLKRHRPPLSNVARGGGEGWRPPRRHREDERRRSWNRDGKAGETKRKEDANERRRPRTRRREQKKERGGRARASPIRTETRSCWWTGHRTRRREQKESKREKETLVRNEKTERERVTRTRKQEASGREEERRGEIWSERGKERRKAGA